jgi:hypothetical protein
MAAPENLIRRPDWRRFAEADWYGFAGAERFENGDEPWIAEVEVDGQPAVAIVDATGVSVFLPEGDGPEDESWAASDGNAIVGLAERTSRVELDRLGFRSMRSEPD